jgi:hypothetical protein
MHLVYFTYIYKWVIYNLYNYTWPVWATHDLYKSALALCILFHFLRLLYIYSSPYLIRDTHLLNILLLGYYCVLHMSDYLAIVGGRTSARRNPTRTILGNQAIE